MTATDLAAPATSFAESDRLLARLSDRKTAWTQVSIPQRIAYVQRCITRVLKVAESWADACSLGHAVMHHAGSSANRTLAFEFSGAGDCRLALRDRRCQSVGRCCRLFDDERDVESIPRPCPRRHSVGARCRTQCLSVRSAAKIRHPRAVLDLAFAVMVYRPSHPAIAGTAAG